MFPKVSSSIRSRTKSESSATYELDKNQSGNCSVYTRLILDSQDSSSSKIITPPSVSLTIAPPLVSKTIDPPSSQHQCVNSASSVSETSKHSWFVKPKREELSEYFKFHPHQPETTKFNSKNVYF